MILQAIIECGSPEACAAITKAQYKGIRFMIYLTLYFSIGLLTVKAINDRSYNIFDKLTMLGVSQKIIYISKAFLYSTWPILWLAISYGFIRSKINNIRK